MYYRSVGRVPAKRHTILADEGGDRLHEELMGTRGFSGPSSLLYHLYSPSELTAAEPGPTEDLDWRANQPIRPMHLPAGGGTTGTDLVSGRRPVAANADVRLSRAAASESSPLYRSVVGDELVFVRTGRARLESTFGSLDVEEGDYVVVPAGTTHRGVPHAPVEALVVAATGHVSIPERYLGPTGQFLEGAPFCERDLRGPEEPMLVDGADVEVVVRTRAGLTRHTMAHHPFDVVGWDGCVYPYALAISDFEPIVGRIHQPPPVHQTFAGPGFVVCSFVPRPFDFDSAAVKVPYHHSNVDSDEVLYYVAGEFMSRGGVGIGPGSLTIHPAGFTHGPHPGSWERSLHAARTEETAVMIDTFSPLQLSAETVNGADPGYPRSWLDMT